MTIAYLPCKKPERKKKIDLNLQFKVPADSPTGNNREII